MDFMFSLVAMLMALIAGLNDLWGNGLEAVTGTAALVAAVPGVWYMYLPRYTAVVLHDGEAWMDIPAPWSERRDTVAHMKATVKEMLRSKAFLTADDAHLPQNPEEVHYGVVWTGPFRGVFKIVPVHVTGEDHLKNFPGRTSKCPVFFEGRRPHPPL